MSIFIRALPAAALAFYAFASPAVAADTTVDVTDISSPLPLPAGTVWGKLAGDNNGTAEITTTQPRSGTGSLELGGDLTRVQTGYQYGNAAGGASNMGLLDSVLGIAYDWMVANDSSNLTAPALRLLVQDGTTRSELVWVGAENGVPNGTATPGVWNITDFSASFYRYTGGAVTTNNGAQVNDTIAGWAASSYFSDAAFVSGISVGSGSGYGAGYHAFADNVQYGTASGTTTYNFEAAAAVPEPATWAMMIIGFVGVGASLRSRRRLGTVSMAA